eukprot:CAMPEP_0119342004 /NCGR_PEP_ID=MMETSP1333-20130426/103797_1 /TAXON_ID=418940 /ORGANISM="Scyphosphaera apsteinii, Strain RCC1455" /LENGTH=86 /DNA_ID=CAMNT_0007354123 /DNA_START=58 /DNA_END=319 /DNA_ORIENTATION=-
MTLLALLLISLSLRAHSADSIPRRPPPLSLLKAEDGMYVANARSNGNGSGSTRRYPLFSLPLHSSSGQPLPNPSLQQDCDGGEPHV